MIKWEQDKTQKNSAEKRKGERNIGTTISGMMGQGSIRHNNREFTAANVDRERSEQNIVFVNEDLKRTYNNLFGEALETYNAGKEKDKG